MNKRYTKEDKQRVIELIESNHSDGEIVEITGFTISYVGSTSTKYWKAKMDAKEETEINIPMATELDYLRHADKAKAKRIKELQGCIALLLDLNKTPKSKMNNEQKTIYNHARQLL